MGIGSRPGRRVASSLRRRFVLGLNRARRTAILRRAAGRAAGRMFATGIRPQSLYGHCFGGLSKFQRALYLRSARKAAGAAGFQACPFSTVRIKLGTMPLVHAWLEQIKTWISIWQMSEDRAALTKPWRVARDQLTNSPSWSHVHGPIGATVLTLIETGWVPSQTSLWLHPANEECATLSTPEPYAVSSILDAYKQSLVDQEWKQAARHFKSSGLELGEPSLVPLAQARKILAKRANSEKQARRDQTRFGSAAAMLAALD